MVAFDVTVHRHDQRSRTSPSEPGDNGAYGDRHDGLDVGLLILSRAVQDLRKWTTSFPALRVAVTLSASQVAEPNAVQRIYRVVTDADISPTAVIVRIASDLGMVPVAVRNGSTKLLRAQGFSVHLDGVDRQGLFQLIDVRVDGMTMTRQLVASLGTRTADAVVSGVAGIGRTLNLSVVAAGIDTPEQLTLARTLGVTHGQGLLWGLPSPADQVPGSVGTIGIAASFRRSAVVDKATGMLAQYHHCTLSNAHSALTLRSVVAGISTADYATRLIDGSESIED